MARVGEKESRARKLGPTVSGGGVLGQVGACSSVVGGGNRAWFVPHHYLGVFVPHACVKLCREVVEPRPVWLFTDPGTSASVYSKHSKNTTILI